MLTNPPNTNNQITRRNNTVLWGAFAVFLVALLVYATYGYHHDSGVPSTTSSDIGANTANTIYPPSTNR